LKLEDSRAQVLVVGAGFAMVDGETVLGCGGVIPRWTGCGEVWISISEELAARPLLLVRHTRKMIKLIRATAHFNRLDMHVPSGNVRLTHWAKSLGFTFEGTMLRYGMNGEDHDLYAIT
jgi:hypothetical protein